MDVFAIEDFYVYSDRIALHATGLQVEIPEGFELQVRPRSGMVAKEGVTVANAPGTIDSDYRGEIKIMLIKMYPGHTVIRKGDRIAQLVLAQVEEPIIEEATSLTTTSRGSGGFGSTGK
jgi:dUTP pyrophosphatase